MRDFFSKKSRLALPFHVARKGHVFVSFLTFFRPSPINPPMTQAHPIPGRDDLDSLVRCGIHPRTHQPVGARFVLAVILLQVLILTVAPFHPEGKVPPPCLTLLDFLGGYNFNLPPFFAARLRAVLLPLVCALPYPYEDEDENAAESLAEVNPRTPLRPSIRARAPNARARFPRPARRRAAHPHLTPILTRARPPPAPPKNAISAPELSHAQIVPAS